MHRICILVAVMGWLAVCAPAVSITPAEARKEAEHAVYDLISLNNAVIDYHFYRGEWDQAIVGLERGISLNAKQTENYASAGWLLWSTGRTEQAIAYYNRMIEANPTDPQAYFEMGVFYTFHLKNDAEAVRWLEKAVALGIPLPRRHVYGHVLAKLGRTAEALAFWKQVLAEQPDDEVARREIEKLSKTTTPLPPEKK
ncbi:MAG: tetratricopeptide repeat protein [Armatimonadota bacterium]